MKKQTAEQTQAPKHSRRTMHLIASTAGIDLRTVERAFAGQTKPNPLTQRAIVDACLKLGIER